MNKETDMNKVSERQLIKDAKADYEVAVRNARIALREMMRYAKDQARFSKLTMAQKRVLIAQDVLLQIQTEKIIPTQGLYYQPSGGEGDKFVKQTTKVVEAFDDPGCQACAKGSLFIAACKLKNGTKLRDLPGLTKNANDPNMIDVSSVDNSTIVNYLDDVFDAHQLDLIEDAFEDDEMAFTPAEKDKLGFDGDDCVRYLGGVDDAVERLETVMKNVVENKGTFKPLKRDLYV